MSFGAVGEFAVGESESESGVSLQPSGIVSAEAFGVPFTSSTSYSLFPIGIVSGEVFGLTHANVKEVFPVGIASAEVFGSAATGLAKIYLPVSRI